MRRKVKFRNTNKMDFDYKGYGSKSKTIKSIYE